MDKKIDVSVCMLTYYHEKYIRMALDSVLMQKTKYRYEIVISDDCSEDNTVSILNEYEKQYPDIIRVNRNQKNIGIPKNIYLARCMCRGTYIIHLSGDDYWIRDDKIEKQVRFLETHPEYIGVCVGMELRLDDSTKAYKILPKPKETNMDFTLKDYEKGKTLYTHGMMIRNFFLNSEGREYFKKAQEISDKVDDAVDNVLMLRKGKMYIMNLVTDVYRVPSRKEESHNYNSKYSSVEKTKNSICLYNNLYKCFGNELSFKQRYVNTFSVAVLKMLMDRNVKEYMKIYQMIPEKYRKPFINGVLIRCIPISLKLTFQQMIVVFGRCFNARRL